MNMDSLLNNPLKEQCDIFGFCFFLSKQSTWPLFPAVYLLLILMKFAKISTSGGQFAYSANTWQYFLASSGKIGS